MLRLPGDGIPSPSIRQIRVWVGERGGDEGTLKGAWSAAAWSGPFQPAPPINLTLEPQTSLSMS